MYLDAYLFSKRHSCQKSFKVLSINYVKVVLYRVPDPKVGGGSSLKANS